MPVDQVPKDIQKWLLAIGSGSRSHCHTHFGICSVVQEDRDVCNCCTHQPMSTAVFRHASVCVYGPASTLRPSFIQFLPCHGIERTAQQVPVPSCSLTTPSPLHRLQRAVLKHVHVRRCCRRWSWAAAPAPSRRRKWTPTSRTLSTSLAPASGYRRPPSLWPTHGGLSRASGLQVLSSQRSGLQCLAKQHLDTRSAYQRWT